MKKAICFASVLFVLGISNAQAQLAASNLGCFPAIKGLLKLSGTRHDQKQTMVDQAYTLINEQTEEEQFPSLEYAAKRYVQVSGQYNYWHNAKPNRAAQSQLALQTMLAATANAKEMQAHLLPDEQLAKLFMLANPSTVADSMYSKMRSAQSALKYFMAASSSSCIQK